MLFEQVPHHSKLRQRMSASGHKDPAPQINVRFTTKSGHCIAPQRMSAMCQKQTHALQQITSAAIAGKRVYNLGGFKDWADSGGEVEK